MIPDELFGAFEQQLADAAQSSAFKHHPDGSVRMFGGYNVMTFGDMFQIPPIPDSGALFLPPKPDKIVRRSQLLHIAAFRINGMIVSFIADILNKSSSWSSVWSCKLPGSLCIIE